MSEFEIGRQDFANIFALTQLEGLGDTLVARLLLKYGAPPSINELWFEPATGWERRVAAAVSRGVPDALVGRGLVAYDNVIALGGKPLTLLHDEYPLSVSQLDKAPPILYVLGDLQEDDNFGVAVVGTRSPSDAGQKSAYWLAGELAKAGVTVISGLAKGIDTAAHSGALSAHGRTIGVIGTGVDIFYPPENKTLSMSIVASGGAIVSQFEPGSQPKRWTFPVRNRLMSGMAQGTVVVEAGPTSGAKLQAEFAIEQNRVLFLMEQQVITHEWARMLAEEDKAVVVKSVGDVLEHILSVEDLGKLPDNLHVVTTPL